ncbi:MAG: hypothetical protein V4509_01960 [Patescibacteria group bacterium]
MKFGPFELACSIVICMIFTIIMTFMILDHLETMREFDLQENIPVGVTLKENKGRW